MSDQNTQVLLPSSADDQVRARPGGVGPSARRKLKGIVEQFRKSADRVLILPFDGTRLDVSRHWHEFLKKDLWQMLKKTAVLLLTRYMHSGPLKNALLRS